MVTTTLPAKKQPRTETLREMRQRLYNSQAASQARQSAQATPNHFDAQAYRGYVTGHPVFSNLHLVSEDDE